ncbi:MAG: hypothetical protein U0836_14535 [Pirellulales bacterium]
MFLGLTVFGVICAALLNASGWWTVALYALFYLSLFYTAFRAALLGRSAAFSVGYALTGWLLMVLLAVDHEWRLYVAVGSDLLGEVLTPQGQPPPLVDEARMAVVTVLWTLLRALLSLIGGFTALWIAARNRPPSEITNLPTVGRFSFSLASVLWASAIVVLAVVALLSGLISDRRRLVGELSVSRAEVEVHKTRQDDSLAHLATEFAQYFDATGEENGDTFVATGGELNEMLAYSLVASGVPHVRLEQVTFADAAQRIMNQRYDCRVDGDKHQYSLRQQ